MAVTDTEVTDTVLTALSRKSTIPTLKTDIHSHLVPGVDDGIESMEEAIRAVLKLHRLGYERLVVTPHIMMHRFPNRAEDLKKIFDELRRQIEVRNIPVALFLAAEYYLDEHLLDLIKRGEVLTFGNNHLLFELSYHCEPFLLEQIILEMHDAGYRPVLAHPERYLYWHHNFEKFIWLREELQVALQINFNSLVGYYSRPVKKIAEKFFKEGMVDFLGSDTHAQQHLAALEKARKSKIYRKYRQNNYIVNDFLELA